MRRKRDEVEEVEEVDQKILKQKESREKRRTAKQKDKVARWGGLILPGLIMFVGFLMWVSGEMKQDPTSILK